MGIQEILVNNYVFIKGILFFVRVVVMRNQFRKGSSSLIYLFAWLCININNCLETVYYYSIGLI